MQCPQGFIPSYLLSSNTGSFLFCQVRFVFETLPGSLSSNSSQRQGPALQKNPRYWIVNHSATCTGVWWWLRLSFIHIYQRKSVDIGYICFLLHV